MSWADHAVLVLLMSAVPAVNVYPFVLAFRPWRNSPQGQALMMKALGNVIVIDVVMATLLFGDYPFRDAIRLLGFTLFTCGVNYLATTLLVAPGAESYPPRSWWRKMRDSRARRWQTDDETDEGAAHDTHA